MRSESEFLVDVLGRLNAAGRRLHVDRLDGQQLLGHPANHARSRFRARVEPGPGDRLVAAFDPGFFIQPESVRSAFRPPFQFNVLDEQSALKADFWIAAGQCLRADGLWSSVAVCSLRRRRHGSPRPKTSSFTSSTGTGLSPSERQLVMPPACMRSSGKRSTCHTSVTGHRHWVLSAHGMICGRGGYVPSRRRPYSSRSARW